MVTTFLFDFSRVLLLPKDTQYQGGLNVLHQELSQKPSYNFLDHFELNMPLIEFLKSIQEKKELYMFTNESIQTQPEVKPIIDSLFHKIFSAMEMGIPKSDPKAYVFIANALNKVPQEILFIDDSEENVRAAKKALFSAIKFTTTQDLITELQLKYLWSSS